MSVRIHPSWEHHLAAEFEQPYFKELTAFVKSEYEKGTVYPPPGKIFAAFDSCPFDKVKVVILGQDPYHGAGQAHGLSFSVSEGVRVPPSLQNIYKEIQTDLGLPIRGTGDLSAWVQQGVLLLNATLTVRAGEAGSHQRKGWEQFTDAVIRILSEEKEHLVFLLWGRYAQAKGAIIDQEKHLILKAAHPSPFSADQGFFGCKHFSQSNDYLVWHGQKPIQWT